jgi:ABC-type uncharacterized transport system substrate-binding protein
MKNWSDGVVEYWSGGSISLTAASLQYSNTPSLCRQLKFIWLALCALLFALSFPVQAQQPKRFPQIGFLVPGSATSYGSRIEAFRKGLRELNYREGQNVNIEYRYAEGKLDRLTELAAELARLKVDMIVTWEAHRSMRQNARLRRFR